MTAARIILFTGPTLAQNEVRARAPDIEVLGPVAYGDLLRLDPQPGDVLGIIDGLFYQVGSVRHKELLWAISRGVSVVGASSMGALRAAELDGFGMAGVGRVFQLYRRGVIDRDDEVAVAHADDEHAYVATSEALVNIRYTVREAVRRGVLGRSYARLIVAAASEMPFEDRTFQQVVDHATASGMPRGVGQRLLEGLEVVRRDVKREDAERLVEILATYAVGPTAVARPGDFSPTSWFCRWRQHSCGSASDQGEWIRDVDVLRCAQLFASDFPKLYYRAILEELAGSFDPEIDAAASTVRALEQLVAAHVAALAGVVGRNLPSALRSWLTAAELASLGLDQQLAKLATRSYASPRSIRRSERLIDALKEHGGFERARDLYVTIRRFNRDAAGSGNEPTELSGSAGEIAGWFIKRWRAEHARLAILDRGFSDTGDFLSAARQMFRFDRSTNRSHTLRVSRGCALHHPAARTARATY